MDPLVSIVINNYNYAPFLDASILSVLAQSYRHIELLIVDDASTDASSEIIKRYASEAKVLAKSSNQGQGDSYNRGFAACQGECIVFLDADDVLMPSTIACALSLMSDPCVVKVHWPMQVIDAEGVSLAATVPSNPCLPSGDLLADVLEHGPDYLSCSPGSGNLYRRSYLQQILPLDPQRFRTGADAPLICMAPFYGRIGAVDQCLAYYRRHGSNDSSSLDLCSSVTRALSWFDAYLPLLLRFCEQKEYGVTLDHWRQHSWWHSIARILNQITPLGHEARILWLDDGVISSWSHPLEWIQAYHSDPEEPLHLFAQIEACRQQGVQFLAVVKFCFYWLELYPESFALIQERFETVIDTADVLVYKLCGRGMAVS